jgi:hypothetical protein
MWFTSLKSGTVALKHNDKMVVRSLDYITAFAGLRQGNRLLAEQ